jgi:hypothetical protein
MTIDERLEALTMNMELLSRDVETLRDSVGILRESVGVLRDTTQQLVTAVTADGENIRALARIAEIHNHRLNDLEGGR